MSKKNLIKIAVGVPFAGLVLLAVIVAIMAQNLPPMITVQDYDPLLVSEVYDRKGAKIGEFFRENRTVLPYAEIPDIVKKAFLAAEDSSFFEHGGINYLAVLRSIFANISAGKKVQGGSTITQQVARSLLLTREKTYTRKIKEVLLSYEMEKNLSKEDIFFLYLNQIYLGHGAYGVASAAQIYFRKPVQDLTVTEAAMLAGLPQAPSRYSPISNPSSAKARQIYVLRRMADEDMITDEDAKKYSAEPLSVYTRPNYEEIAPYFVETVRQMLVERIGEDQVLDEGLKIFTSLDINKQKEAQKQVRLGLHALDKRQGYRGPIKNIQEPEEVAKFLLTERNNIIDDFSPLRIIRADGTIVDKGPLNLTGKTEDGQIIPNLPDYVKMDEICQGIVTQIDDKWGLVYVRFGESKGLIDLETMAWARKPDPDVDSKSGEIKKPSLALKKGDVIMMKVTGKVFVSPRLEEKFAEMKKRMKAKYVRPSEIPNFEEFAKVELEQKPKAEGSLLSFDLSNGDILAMVGGYSFSDSQFNRSLQAARQTGSSFKTFVYASALDKGYTPVSKLLDAPLIFEEKKKAEPGTKTGEAEMGEGEIERWKPANHANQFFGEILFRNAFVRSLNVPTVKIIEKIGVDWVSDYARRLGVFSPLNMDFTLALGSSSVTLYEMTKAFSQIANLGRKYSPMFIHKVQDRTGQVLVEKVSLDERFKANLQPLEETFEERRKTFLSQPREPAKPAATTTPEGEATTEVKEKEYPKIFFSDANQLMRKETAFVTTSLLKAAIDEPEATGGAARALGRPAAGKTGTTSNYYDAWFVGYTPDIATGVWVGYDDEKSLGRGEVGGRAALPIWLEYMKVAHENMPIRDFAIPPGVVMTSIDNESGKLASPATKVVVKQPFVPGTEPTQVSGEATPEDARDFYKEEMAE